MFVSERHEKILEQLATKGQVRVKDLAAQYNVTEDLIRKDLAALESAGKLRRKYGGAVPISGNPAHVFTARKKILNMEAKRAIAAKAFSLIEPGMIVYLDISTTNVVLAQMIAQSSLEVTVVTNMLEIMSVLSNSRTHLIAIGGELDFGREGFIGPIACETLRNFRFDLCFIGAVGIEADGNALTGLMASESLTKRLVLEHSARSYLVCESEKLKVMGNYQFATLDAIDGVIMEKNPGDDIREIFASHLTELL